jgi:acylphosphatase
MDQDEARAGFLVAGRVQGVGFRWWTLRTARGLGLHGTVRNRPDGSVEVHAAGSRSALSRFASALRDGPAHARVDAVESIPSFGSLPPDFRVLP